MRQTCVCETPTACAAPHSVDRRSRGAAWSRSATRLLSLLRRPDCFLRVFTFMGLPGCLDVSARYHKRDTVRGCTPCSAANSLIAPCGKLSLLSATAALGAPFSLVVGHVSANACCFLAYDTNSKCNHSSTGSGRLLPTSTSCGRQ